MINSLKIFVCIMIVSLMVCGKSFAHPGGHYTNKDISVLHHWNVKAGDKKVIGNFMMFKNNLVFIEGINGNEWAIKYNELSGDDLVYVNNEISKIEILNRITPDVINPSSDNIGSGLGSKSLIFLFITGFFAIAFYLLTVFVKNRNYNVKWRVAFSGLSLVFLILFFISCKKNNGDDNTNTDLCSGVTVTLSLTTTNPDTGLSNGSISASASPGSGFTYSLNGGSFQASGTFTNLTPGTYTITAKNTNGCSGSSTATLVYREIPRTSTGLLDSAFEAFLPSVTTDYDNTYYNVYSGGYPNHNMMVGITSWQQQVPIPQYYNLPTNHWSIPLQPVYADVPMSTRSNFMKGAVAIAVNGIPIFNALNNRGEDAYAIGELDQWGGHCGRADDYHYHAAPLHLSAIQGLKPIAFALDGFAVYADKEPDGSNMQTLDTCHGHVIGNGTYHYHGTSTYPYVVGSMRGKVTLDPTTPAPENQILPQAFATPCRPFLNALAGASITGFTSPGTNAYNLTYNINNKPAHVNYHWIPTATADTFYFEFIDTGGVITTAKYTRRK